MGDRGMTIAQRGRIRGERDGRGTDEALTRGERERIEEQAAPRAVAVHEIVRHEGEIELGRPISALLWSGLAAGLSMGFSMVGEGLLRAGLPDAPWRPLVASFGYGLGF
jgi:hypothetical protein